MIEDHLRGQGFSSVRCLPNVADVEVFAAARTRAPQRRPVAVFAGTLARHKVDLDLLADLAEQVPVRLVGPVVDATDDPAWPRLLAAGAEVVGPMPATDLADELARAGVGLVPYRLSSLTAGISPLKTFEYLAAGLPVVSTALPAVTPAPGAVWVEDRPAFVARVRNLLADTDTDTDRPGRVAQLAQGQDWTSRGRELRALAGALLAT